MSGSPVFVSDTARYKYRRTWHLLSFWLWRWPPLRLSKHQSLQPTVFLKTTLTWMINFFKHVIITFNKMDCSHLQWYSHSYFSKHNSSFCHIKWGCQCSSNTSWKDIWKKDEWAIIRPSHLPSNTNKNTCNCPTYGRLPCMNRVWLMLGPIHLYQTTTRRC